MKVVIDGKEYEQTEGLICAECQAPLILAKDKHGIRYIPASICNRSSCAGSVGAHPNGKPLGFPADNRTKTARSNAHEEFDRIWKTGIMSRTSAYAWMSEKLGLTPRTAHIGEFDAETCEKLRRVVREEFPDLFPFSLEL